MNALMLVPSILFFLLVIAREWVFMSERREWAQERKELLNRIQHPEVLVPLGNDRPEIEEREPDEINLVGAVIE